MFRLLLVPSLMLATGPALAAPDAASAKKPVLDPDKVICRRVTSIESRIPPKPECRTRREWDAEAGAVRDDRANTSRYRSSTPGG